MPAPANTDHKRLKRLDRAWYRGRSFVHWSMTMADRRTGWLTSSFWEDWAYSGTVFPGYPEMDPRKKYFWENFWKAFERQSR